MNLRAFILAFLIGLNACDKSPNFGEKAPLYSPADPDYFDYDFEGYVKGKKNGDYFEGSLYYSNQSEHCAGCFSLTMYTFEDSIVEIEFLVIRNLNLNKLGRYEVKPETNHVGGSELGLEYDTESYYNTSIEHDEEGDSYRLYEDNPNWIELETVDTTAGIVRGSFLLHFEKYIENDLRNPKYIRFSNMEFEAHITD
jgi:hypothetical protein